MAVSVAVMVGKSADWIPRIVELSKTLTGATRKESFCLSTNQEAFAASLTKINGEKC